MLVVLFTGLELKRDVPWLLELGKIVVAEVVLVVVGIGVVLLLVVAGAALVGLNVVLVGLGVVVEFAVVVVAAITGDELVDVLLTVTPVAKSSAAANVLGLEIGYPMTFFR